MDERHSRADDWHRQGAIKARTSRPAIPINCATYAQDVIEGRVAIQPNHQHTHGNPMLFGPASVISGSLSTDRERQIAQVFQPSHRYCFMGTSWGEGRSRRGLRISLAAPDAPNMSQRPSSSQSSDQVKPSCSSLRPLFNPPFEAQRPSFLLLFFLFSFHFFLFIRNLLRVLPDL